MSKRVKVLHLLLSMNIGGAERVAASIVKGSNAERFQHEVCCLDEVGVFGEELRKQGVATMLLKRKASGVDLLLIPRLAALLGRRKIDVLHTHGETPWFYGSIACTLTLGRTKCITTIHGYGGGDRVCMRDFRLWKVLTALSRTVVLVADVLRDELVSAGFPGDKVKTIVNGIGLPDPINSVAQSRSQWGIDRGVFVIGIVARLSPVKNHRLLFAALARFAPTVPDLRLVVVGDGPERLGLQHLAMDLGINEMVIFCGAKNPAIGFYQLFDIFVLPSLSEGISMTLLEAMSTGIPVVASRVGGNVEIVRDGETGMLFQSGDLDGLCNALATLLYNPRLRTRLAHNAHEMVQCCYSFNSMISSYHNLYQSIVQRGDT